MFTVQLLAQQPAGNPFDRPEIIWATAGLAGALLVGAVVVLMVDKWRKKGLAAASGRSADELTEYREMFESGEITEEEYKRLRAQLAERVKQPPPVPAPDPETGASPLVNGLPRVKPVVPPPAPPEPKPWETPRHQPDPPA